MFDPYHKWLGISPKDQPPNHYRLLSVDLFESDPEVIDSAANRQMAYIQQRATGENIALSQKILNELSAARLCLLDQKKKAAYDLQLKIDLKRQAKRAGKNHLKAPGFAPLARGGLKEPLTDREQTAPPEINAPEQPAEQNSVPQAPEVLRPMRKIIFVGGGCLVFVGILAAILYIWNPGQTPKIQADRGESGNQNIPQKIPLNDQDANTQIKIPPKPAGTAVYKVEIDPPSAILAVQSDRGSITGTGSVRQIRFDNIQRRDSVLITASCDGYEPYSQWLSPMVGQNENLSIVLKKIISMAEKPIEKNNNPAESPPIEEQPPKNPPIIPDPFSVDAGINDWQHKRIPKTTASPKAEQLAVFVFSGTSAIVTPVQRSLPSTVEAWIWCSKPSETSDMYVFGSDNPLQPTGGLGVRIGKNGQLGGRRTQKSQRLLQFETDDFLPIETWTHLAATFSRSKICFFVDGRLIHTDQGAQDMGRAPFVIGYIGQSLYKIPAYCFVGKIRTVRITTGIRYDSDFQPQFEFEKSQEEKGSKTILIYDASQVKGDLITDISGNKNHGQGLNLKIEEESFPIKKSQKGG